MNRGYAGFYKGFYLRSSYEYAYAKYLDFYSIPWSYEDRTFDIGYKLYKPDFFFYDQDGNLKRVVEIISRNLDAKKNAMKALEKIESIYGIKSDLISYEELLNMYIDLPFSLNSILTEWINSNTATINKAAYGKFNGHYNLRHSDEAKKRIGEHTKKLWATENVTKQKMLEGLRKSGLAQKGKIKTPREIRKCIKCNREFEVLKTSKQSYCSILCSAQNAIKLATDAYVNKRRETHKEIKDYIINWSILNEQVVLSTPLNKISTTIYPLVNDIYRKFGVKDFRVISKAVFGEDRGRKELILFMKKVCNEKIC
ncbi:restriction endonuclease [Bacillus sp. V3-13]|uniref:restriction endonuclease n=1 Tax=Bacillus sp. V3-13 TaxID=2053728 RepID=UPI000C75A4A3|nr:restriction endonuclease [Bacillus sp. V3-13]PLR76476.1 restriction endonuclease [Bacillus sp. V3-13]